MKNSIKRIRLVNAVAKDLAEHGVSLASGDELRLIKLPAADLELVRTIAAMAWKDGFQRGEAQPAPTRGGVG